LPPVPCTFLPAGKRFIKRPESGKSSLFPDFEIADGANPVTKSKEFVFENQKEKDYDRFSGADMEKQPGNAKLMIRGMEDLKQVLRPSAVEAISVFEKVERSGMDLSQYDV
jgi:hypothetical protein